MGKYNAFQKQDSRLFKPGVLLSIVVVVLFAGGLGLIIFDILSSPNAIDESNNQAVLGEFRSNINQFKLVETDGYSVEIPEDWVQVNNPEIIVNGDRFYPERFQGVSGANVGRKVDVYTNEIPDIPVERVISVKGSGDHFDVGSISPQCNTFAEKPKQMVDYVPASWDEITFLCTLSDSRNNVATAETDLKNGIVLTGPTTGTKTYLILYTDHGSNLNNDIFSQILSSFKVK